MAVTLADPPVAEERMLGDRLTFLGHSTVLVDLDGVRVLTDPLLGNLVVAAAWLLIVIAAFDGGQWLRRRRADEPAR